MRELELDESTVIAGRGLVLRTWLPEDLDALLQACQDPEIQRWTPLPSPYLPEHAELFLDACALRWVQGLASFAVLGDGGADLLGSIGSSACRRRAPSRSATGWRPRHADAGWPPPPPG